MISFEDTYYYSCNNVYYNDTCNYTYLPSNTFYESSGTYINTEGEMKWTPKLLSTVFNSKNNWEIFRKLISVLDLIKFIKNYKNNLRVYYKNKNIFNFKNFISFTYFNTRNLDKFSFYKKNFNQIFYLIAEQKIGKLKIYKTQLKKWLEDFYLGGNDLYSSESKMMVLCSLSQRHCTTF